MATAAATDVQHFAPDTAGGAYNNDLVTHGCAPWAAAVTGFGRRVQFSAPESIGPIARQYGGNPEIGSHIAKRAEHVRHQLYCQQYR